MYASLVGALAAEDSAKLNRSPTWTWPTEAVTDNSCSNSQRNFPVSTERYTPLAGTVHAKRVVDRPLRLRSQTSQTYSARSSAGAPIPSRGKRASVSDLVGRFESKDRESNTAPAPLHRAATAPSPHLRSVCQSILPSAASHKYSTSQRPPRKQLVSSQAIHGKGSPFTSKQVSAATLFTIPEDRAQTAAFELREACADCVQKNIVVQASFHYLDQATQISPVYKEQSAQAEHSYQHISVQVSSTCQDQATHCVSAYNDRVTQVEAQNSDQVVQTVPILGDRSLGIAEFQFGRSGEIGESAVHDQASQTDYDNRAAEKDLAPNEKDLPDPVIQAVASEDEIEQNPKYTVGSKPHPQSRSSEELVLLEARSCSEVTNTRALLDIGVSFEPRTIPLEYPTGTTVHMLQRIRGDKIVLDLGALPRATSSEALAQGEVYTSGYIRERKPNSVKQNGRSTPCSSCTSNSSCSSVERRLTSPQEDLVAEAAGTADNSRYTEARQRLSSDTHESADESAGQPKASVHPESYPQAHQLVSPTASLPELPHAVNSSIQAVPRAPVNGKRRASSVSYWFESEDENPERRCGNPLIRPQTLAQFRSVPLIRVQRPSTDCEMVFGLGTRAVKSSRSASPSVPEVEAPAVPSGNIAPIEASLPTTSRSPKKHFRECLEKPSKQAILVDDTAGDKGGVRARVKRRGSTFGRKGRQKFILRKKVLRVLLGKELAETVSWTLQTTGKATGTASGRAEPVQTATIEPGASSQAAAPLVQPLPDTTSPPGVTAPAPAQMDGSIGTKLVVNHFPTNSSVDTDVLPIVPTVDGSHEERRAAHRAKKQIKQLQKEQRHEEEYEQAKTNLEALVSTPCRKCGGQKAYILNFVYENKKKMLKHEHPEMKRRCRRKELTKYVESLECRCPLGTGSAAYGSPGAVSNAKEITSKPKLRFASQRINYASNSSSSHYAGLNTAVSDGTAVNVAAASGGACSVGGC